MENFLKDSWIGLQCLLKDENLISKRAWLKSENLVKRIVQEVIAVSARPMLGQGSNHISAGRDDGSECEEGYGRLFKDRLSIGAMETGGLTEGNR